MLIFLRLLALLPLRVMHALGSFGGYLVYWLSPRYGRRLRENLGAAIPRLKTADSHTLLSAAIAEAGKAALETPAVWFRPPSWIRAVVSIDDWDRLEALLALGKGIIFLTPHLGCFEVTAQYFALRHPMTVMFRPPRKAILAPLMGAGRARNGLVPVPANVTGVRALLKALKRGEAIGMLPDQAPREGEGEWADFFGRPAYTMTLAGRLARSSGAPVVLAFGERLPRGRGYHIHLEQGPAPVAGESYEAALNLALEKLIGRCPQQYLWAYDRYKMPKGSQPGSSPPQSSSSNIGGGEST